MTVALLSIDNFYTYLPVGGGAPLVVGNIYRYPFPAPGGVAATYLNKCVDGVTSEWVLWKTFFMDINGTEYPGASFDSGTYKVETIIYDREQ